jgi:hypothetical protein
MPRRNLPVPDDKQQVLRELTFGQRVAEDEAARLSAYFVETDQWRRVWDGQVDIVYGAKGAGKSAIYATLSQRDEDLFDRGILARAAENPQGAPAFQGLITDPPDSEDQFIFLWKLYFLSLLAQVLEDYGVGGEQAKQLANTLRDAGLLHPRSSSLARLVRSVLSYVRYWFNAPESIEGAVALDPTGVPVGLSTKITFRQPTAQEQARGKVYVDDLFELANEALRQDDYHIWLLLDRLDVAFAESRQLEANALRALFRVYLDLVPLDHISLKIFLRSDIWQSITTSGFREASHITRELTIRWDSASLLRLVVQRLLQNPALCRFYQVNTDEILSRTTAQRHLFEKVFPSQVDTGPNKPKTFDWCLLRTRDGTKNNAPRELIHLLSAAREVQLRRLELGEPQPPDHFLFERTAVKDALPEVSEVRLTKTLYAEYAEYRQYLELLEGQKTDHSPKSLSGVWSVSEETAQEIANRLVEIGFFEKRGEQAHPRYWVPFLYRPALQLVQGSAEPGPGAGSDEE